MELIGVVGFIGSGKGTVGDILASEYGYEKLSFAGKLKDAVSVMFNWDRAMLEGDTSKSRNDREVMDEFWSKKFNKTITPRYILQFMGTEVIRNNLHENFWIDALENSLQKNKKYVITDVRFPNEMEMVKQNGGKLVWVKRGPDPEWFEAARFQNRDRKDKYGDVDFGIPSKWEDKIPVHESEWKWIRDESYYDMVIDNNGSLEQLHEKIKILGTNGINTKP